MTEVFSNSETTISTSSADGITEVSSNHSASVKSPYINPSALPVLHGPDGILFDFNQGARIVLPARTEGKWRITLRDLDTGNILFQNENTGATVHSAKRFYVRFGIIVEDILPQREARIVFQHELNLKNKKVVIQFPVGTLGDTLAWFPYAARFAHIHQANVTCILSALIIPVLKDAYPELTLMSPEIAQEQDILADSYAMYCMGLFFDDKENVFQPTDFRLVGLHRTAAYILGVDPAEEVPKLALSDETRPIAEKYVCIAVQASTQCKYWNNPTGWMEIVAYLKKQGYRVICIDQKPVHGTAIVWNHISYRIINWYTYNSCWNDERERFDHHDFLWCPRHANTPRQFASFV
ncbi:MULTISPECIES: autotransporter strand-loop-strand O-heptosyltransferase [Acetobacter]|uniref:autotransporter strand-loop-strand O-heptosyltransferase n=2 Tax=Acetobacteraceae TaxID=433 RepID=UPI000BC30A4F|nr:MULTISPECIES: autotransporter strand-loop-strand O-heptosyltransferase [Acetobacter]ATI12919.1 autotransporter strand-loop-strand O-heptosyltransferase [Acetobacter pomorum]AXC26955.1 autotransporter strand-loop-strand O-heptosyltransferase [Acetobacter sp. JWB]